MDSECIQLINVSVSQGMDPVTRQVGQHIEMEPEWEAAFTLQMKLTNIITMIQDWCSTDVRSFPFTPTHTHTQSSRSISVLLVCVRSVC